MQENRVDPEAMLELANKELSERGVLTVYLGAAAGVGKTYTMLESGWENIREGVDTVVGYVETHGRAETDALVNGLEVIPTRDIEYRGKMFKEMDLDAILARKPHLVLVDEFAHTNIPGSRHAKRYQDVEELLEAGIDVYTTLNIQHIESVNDIVEQITGIAIKETVPDWIVQEGQIQLIDIPTDDLLERLAEGKVYIPEKANEAMQRFFRAGNISALRELALRYTASRVDKQIESYMKAHAIAGPWPASEKILVCIDTDPLSLSLIRSGKRLAEAYQGKLCVAYVERPADNYMNKRDTENLSRALRLAEELDAEVHKIAGSDIASEIVRFARNNNITQMIVGKRPRTRLHEIFIHSVTNKLINMSRGIVVHVITGEATSKDASKATETVASAKLDWRKLGIGVLMALVVTAIIAPFYDAIGIVNTTLAYFIPVVAAGMLGSKRSAVLTALVSIVLFDFIYVKPRFSFQVYDFRYMTSFILFIVVAYIIGEMKDRLNYQLEFIRTRERRAQALVALSREIVAERELDRILEYAVESIANSTGADVMLFMPDSNGKLKLITSKFQTEEDFLDDNEFGVASWVYEHKEMAGAGTDTLNGAAALYLPLDTEEGTQGVLGIRLEAIADFMTPEEERQLKIFANLTAVAIARVRLTEKLQQSKLVEESDKLHKALLSSLSHDLHTPLASIMGSVTALLDNEQAYDDNSRHMMLENINDGAFRMNRLVSNLLEMTKIESGSITLRREWCDIEDLFNAAYARVEKYLEDRRIELKLQENLSFVYADFVMIEQVLINLLDNAVKYSENDSLIEVSFVKEDNYADVRVINRGEGIPEADIKRIFDKFYRVRSPKKVSGSGLGLAICKGIVEAHGGRIEARNIADYGVEFEFTLPKP